MEALTKSRTPRQDPTRLLLVAALLSRRKSLSASITRSFKRSAIEIVSSSGFSTGHAGVFDLVVADIDGSSPAAALMRFISNETSEAGVIALVDDPDPRWVQEVVKAGINAVISREPSADVLHLALSAADAGLVLLHPTSARGLMLVHSPSSELTHEFERLTSREFEVLRLLSDGLGNKEIASRLEISEHTAKFHISSILGKLGVATRTEAVSHGIKKGLIPI